MRTVRIERFEGPSALRVGEAQRPVPDGDDVLVEVRAAAVNRSDVLNSMGSFSITTLPRVPGRDYAGVVVEGPYELVGMEVWGTGGEAVDFTRDGSHAEYMIVPRAAVVAKPESLSFEEAGASGLAYVTAAAALLDLGRLAVGETILITGAAGGVGSAAAMIARWKGARVVGAVKDQSERVLAESMGLEAVIDTSEEDVAESVAEITGGAGADLAFDTVGGPVFEPSLNSLAMNGRMVVIATPPSFRRVAFDLFDFYRRQIRLVGLLTSTLSAPRIAAILGDLAPGFSEGTLSAPPIAERYPLEEASAAYRRVQVGAPGRVLLLPH